MSRVRTLRRLLVAPFLVLLVGACAGMGTLGDVIAGPGGGGIYGNRVVRGEIRSIDARRQEISIASGWLGTERIRYDGRTQVIYRQRRLSVHDLGRGDYIRIQVDNRRRDRPVANRIQVESIADRRYGGRSGNVRLERFDGRVTRVSTRDWTFDIEPSRGRTLRVVMPNNVDRKTADRIRRLRRGERVKIEGYLVDNRTVRLQRFR